MHIIELRAENIKKLVAVKINPDGSLVQITGRNAQGKTSVLDAIWLALDASKVKQEKPVREGQDKGIIRLALGDKEVELIVTRTFKVKDGDTTPSISVTSPDGAKFPSPQALLDKLLSSLTFDPLAFSRMAAPEQVKAVRSLLPGVDFDGVANANKIDFDRRTDLNREVKAAEARALLPAGPAPVAVDTDALVQQLTECSEFNAGIEKRSAAREKAKENIAEWEKEIVARTATIKAEQEEIEVCRNSIQELSESLASAPVLPALRDAAAIKAKIDAAKPINEAVARHAAAAAARDEAARLRSQADALTAAMAGRTDGLAKAVAVAKFPVDGLTFTEDALLLNGLPLNQASDAEQLRTSIAIAMSLNPKLRVIRVRDGSLLDEDGLRLLATMAEERNYQIWIERVDSSGSVGFVMEDGMVKGAEPPTVLEVPAVVPTSVPAPTPAPAPAPASTKRAPTQADLL